MAMNRPKRIRRSTAESTEPHWGVMGWRCSRCQHEKETDRLSEPPKWGNPDARPFDVLLFEDGADFIITCNRHLTVIVRAPLAAIKIENLSRRAM